jgi:glycosyltransferase involved in cell wall biosynthesis
VGEFVERKNIKALIQAFHIEFEPREPVNLFIKTSKVPLETIQGYCTQVKKGLKIRKSYSEEVVVAGIMPKKDYISVLSQVNCFVMPSRGEAFCIPALEAMTLGIPAIYTEGIGMDFCIGTTVESKLVPCFGAVDTLPDLDTAATSWSEIDILKLSKAMRKAYNEHSTEEEALTKKACFRHADNFGHKSVGEQMKELLRDS